MEGLKKYSDIFLEGLKKTMQSINLESQVYVSKQTEDPLLDMYKVVQI
jgi:hypothetical protein